MTTKEIINKALEVMNGQDCYWFMSDYQVAEMRDKAYGTMRYYVELVASINDSTIRKALRELWKATYENKHANMWRKNEAASQMYETKKAELMAVILPSYNMAA